MDELLKVFIDGKGTFYQRVQLSDNIEKEPDTGYLYCKNAILGHVGEQAYNGWEVGLSDQKVVYIKREAQDVFDEASLASIKGKPITLGHPDELVNSKNFKDYVVGFIDEVWRDGDNLVGVIVIQDEKAIDAVERGELKDLSLGYTARLVKDSNDGKFKQTEIIINHLAIVAEGRAKNARIVDEKTVVEEQTEETTTEQVVVENTEKKKEVVNKMKTFVDFMKDWKEINAMPKSEFRDKAYEALNAECKEALQVDLPALEVVVIKDEAIEKSVGLKDSEKDNPQEPEKKPMKVYAVDEERYFQKLYRSFDDKETARKYANMSYHDVIEQLEGKGR